MSGFSVNTKALDAAGGDLLRLSYTVYYANHNLAYLDTSGSGKILGLVAGELDSVRTDLEPAYRNGGTAEELIAGAGNAFQKQATDYLTVDQAQRAEYDAKLAEVTDDPFIWTYGDDNGADVDYYEYQRKHWGEPENAFESYDDWVAIRDGVDYVAGFDWVTDVLGGLGLPIPLTEFVDNFEGDWKELGIAVGAVERLASYWQRVDLDLNSMAEELPNYWKGNAADSAQAWLVACGGKFADHGSAMGGLAQRISAEGYALFEAVRFITDIIEDIVDLLPEPDSLLGFLKDTVTAPAKAAKLALKVSSFVTWFDIALIAGHSIVAAFAQLTRFHDTDFPEIPSYDAADVNGPKA